jgi:repressor LexA
MGGPQKNRELTPRQRVVLDAIRGWIQKHGYPPTIRELGQQLGIKSLRGVTTHLDAIAKKGFLKREPRARSISLAGALQPLKRALSIPLVGRISAGVPLLAEENVEDHVTIDGAWLGQQAENGMGPQHFALKVRGQSMIQAGIFDGDFVIVRHQQVAHDGDIVVALIGDEATVKRFFRQADKVVLQPENPSMAPIVVTPDRGCSILGKVVAVFRSVG